MGAEPPKEPDHTTPRLDSHQCLLPFWGLVSHFFCLEVSSGVISRGADVNRRSDQNCSSTTIAPNYSIALAKYKSACRRAFSCPYWQRSTGLKSIIAIAEHVMFVHFFVRPH